MGELESRKTHGLMKVFRSYLLFGYKIYFLTQVHAVLSQQEWEKEQT
jgi:hypothetical protein